ncbi:DUF4126 domain-containing protein [Luteococcus sp. H138]|uniref:DUF4126 domain-containing protein n=1 Tax=unclassified Luteococcus TaxID=2639923 RepID=UPI00313E4945
MELLPLTFASGWASGLNAWATVLVLGLLGRFAHVGEVPTGFQRADVLIVMAVLATIELLADKIPLLDSTWDAASTVVRPVAGAVIAALIAGQTGSLTTIALASIGGVSALLSHITKSGLRLAINTSPEPVSNVAASVANDVSLVTVLALAAEHPVPAAVLAGVLLVTGLVLFALVFTQIRRGVAMVRRNLAGLRGSTERGMHEDGR